MKKLLFILILVGGLKFSNAQINTFQWALQIGDSVGDIGTAIATDALGNVYTVGYFEYSPDFDPGVGVFNMSSFGNVDVFITKFDIAGNFIWAKQVGGTNTDYPLSIKVDAVGNVYTCGFYTTLADFDPGVGTYTLGGSGFGNFAFVLKLDPSGNFVFAKGLGGVGTSSGFYGMDLDTSNNIYLTGNFGGTCDFDPGAGVVNMTASSGFADSFILKLDAIGNYVWAKQISGSDSNGGGSIAVDTAGNVFIVGSFKSTADFDPGPSTFTMSSNGSEDIYFLKLNKVGNLVWVKQIGSTNSDLAYSITLDANCNVYSTGHFGNIADFDPGPGVFNIINYGGDDVYVSKLDSSGNFVWAKQIGGTGNDQAFSITLDASANVYTAGRFSSNVADFNPGLGSFLMGNAGFYDGFINKLDSAGNFVWAEQIAGAGLDHANCVTLDISGNVYTTGYFFGTCDFDQGPGTFTLSATGGGAMDAFIHKMCQSCALTIKENFKEGITSLFPNPTKDLINLNISEDFIGGNIQLLDAIGKIIQTQAIKNTTEKINLNLNSGIYFIKATTKDGVSKTEKLVVE